MSELLGVIDQTKDRALRSVSTLYRIVDDGAVVGIKGHEEIYELALKALTQALRVLVDE